MNKKIIPESELIINPDGSVFHLHLLPEQLTDRVILGVTRHASIWWQNFSTPVLLK